MAAPTESLISIVKMLLFSLSLTLLTIYGARQVVFEQQNNYLSDNSINSTLFMHRFNLKQIDNPRNLMITDYINKPMKLKYKLEPGNIFIEILSYQNHIMINSTYIRQNVNTSSTYSHTICIDTNTATLPTDYLLARDLDINVYTVMCYHMNFSRRVKSIPVKFSFNHRLIILLLSGDVALNPGPVKIPCGKCKRPVAKNHRALKCYLCNINWHIKCAEIRPSDYNTIRNSNQEWRCKPCEASPNISNLPTDDNTTIHPNIDIINTNTELNSRQNVTNITNIEHNKCENNYKDLNDSYTPPDDDEENWDKPSMVSAKSPGITNNPNLDTSTNSNDDSICNTFHDVEKLRNMNKKRPIIGHININSIRYKFQELLPLFEKFLVDVFCISETKIDDSFNDSLFSADGYKLHRCDRNIHGGGLMTFVRADLPIRRRKDMECKGLENLCFEFILDIRKWAIICVYRPPKMKDKEFEGMMTNALDKIFLHFDHVIVIGDLNYDLSSPNKGKTLLDIMESFSLINLIKEPTCFKNAESPTLIDVILTNSHTFMCNTSVYNCSISDFHSMIFTCIREQISARARKHIQFRSYKNFDENKFNEELCNALNNYTSYPDNNSDMYSIYNDIFTETLNKHAPIKKKMPNQNPPPYMNSKYRKVIYQTRQAHNKYLKYKSPILWEKYRQLRNLKTKIKRESIKTYFTERCGEGPKSKDFWNTIKPFLSKKSLSNSTESIIIKTDDGLESDQQKVCDLLNDFYINIAKNIGINNSTQIDTEHPSISKIIENNQNQTTFNFSHITPEITKKHLKKLNPKKATGCDNIPPKILRTSADTICYPLTDIINNMIDQNCFPDLLKKAQVTPVYKKDDPFTLKNYRPVSILPAVSKIFERVLNSQLMEHFNTIFHNYLAAFRPGYGCQTTLLRLVEDWRLALDKGEYVAAILMDLSKAFDCLPHDLLVLKMGSYGLSENACSLLHNYLSNRKQTVKIGQNQSSWLEISKGVPQGSILGPQIFNIFINDIFYFITNSKLYNYADDNTLSHNHTDPNILKQTLEKESDILINWFNINQMQANPEKFQAISIGKKSHEIIKSFEINNTIINCEDSVKLLGIELDYLLNFDQQISNMCMKAARQLNVLQRISKFLNLECRLLAYKSFIRSNFNYCPVIWHYCSKTNTEKLEKLQFRALKIVFNDYKSCYEDLLSKAKVPTLYQSRIRTIAIETFKCLYELSPPYVTDLVNFKSSNYSSKYQNTAEVPMIRTVSYGKQSFKYDAARVWNSLPNDIRITENYGEFVRLIRTWDGPSCHCAMCN